MSILRKLVESSFGYSDPVSLEVPIQIAELHVMSSIKRLLNSADAFTYS